MHLLYVCGCFFYFAINSDVSRTFALIGQIQSVLEILAQALVFGRGGPGTQLVDAFQDQGVG